MDNTIDDLQDTFVCSSTEEVEQLQTELEEFKAGPLQEASGNYDELNALVTTMAELGSTDNPYTTLTPTVSRWMRCRIGSRETHPLPLVSLTLSSPHLTTAGVRQVVQGAGHGARERGLPHGRDGEAADE